MPEDVKVVATNRKAGFEYFLLERFEAGLSLQGSEIKSIRAGKVNLGEGYARLKDDELFLYNVHIAQYGPARENHEPTRPRKLLLHRRELDRMRQALEEQPRTTVIPLRLYLHNGLIKVEIGLARGKRRYDKREAIKEREADRSMQRAIRHAVR